MGRQQGHGQAVRFLPEMLCEGGLRHLPAIPCRAGAFPGTPPALLSHQHSLCPQVPVSPAGAASSAGRAAAQEGLLSVRLSLPGLASPGSSTLPFLLASAPGRAAAGLVPRLPGDGGFTCPWSEPSGCLGEGEYGDRVRGLEMGTWSVASSALSSVLILFR